MRFSDQQVASAAAALLKRSGRGIARLEAKRRRIQKRLSKVKQALQERFAVSRIFVVGSLDMPWFAPESDVDLVVEGLDARQAPAAERLAVKILEVPVDLLRLEELDASFRETVAREGRLIP